MVKTTGELRRKATEEELVAPKIVAEELAYWSDQLRGAPGKGAEGYVDLSGQAEEPGEKTTEIPESGVPAEDDVAQPPTRAEMDPTASPEREDLPEMTGTYVAPGDTLVGDDLAKGYEEDVSMIVEPPASSYPEMDLAFDDLRDIGNPEADFAAANRLDGHGMAKRIRADADDEPAPQAKRERTIAAPPEPWETFVADLERLRELEGREQAEPQTRYRMRCRRARTGKRAHLALHASKKKTPAQQRKDKEVQWNGLSPADQDLFREAIAKEWKSWLDLKAVKVLPANKARGVPKSRVLPSRFVLTNKNKQIKGASLQAKARLVCGGQLDPDLQGLRTDAPTCDLMGLQTLLTWAASKRWRIQSGDVSSAFLNGLEDKRSLYLRPP